MSINMSIYEPWVFITPVMEVSRHANALRISGFTVEVVNRDVSVGFLDGPKLCLSTFGHEHGAIRIALYFGY
jgi:hypothetical protein